MAAPGSTPESGAPRSPEIVPLLVGVICLLAVCVIPLKIVGYGFEPPDDALRHAAKAVSGKAWQEIMVMRPEITIDHNHGWHAILAVVHRATRWETDGLVVFSCVVLFVLLGLSGLPWLRRPESWLVALLALNVLTRTAMTFRLMLGRPYLLAMAVLVAILFSWTRRGAPRPRPALLITTTVLIALAVYVHGSWYLFALPVAAFLLARRWRKGALLAACWLAGTVAGAALTGHPVRFIVEQVAIAQSCLGGMKLQRVLASEFRGFDGDAPVVLAVAFFLLWRRIRGGSIRESADNPVFALVALGWVLGFSVQRFWVDWGWPALLVWMSREVQDALERAAGESSWTRLPATLLVAASLYLSSTGDLGGRWTESLQIERLTPDQEELEGWLPEDGGILYSDNTGIFYQTFFKNPRAGWRYAPGYEWTFMPREDAETFHTIVASRGDPRAYLPWARKARPEDRLAIHYPPGPPPPIPPLEWKYVLKNVWIGRLPREASPPAP